MNVLDLNFECTEFEIFILYSDNGKSAILCNVQYLTGTPNSFVTRKKYIFQYHTE